MIQLRMRGAPPALFVSALLAIAPVAFCLYEVRVEHQPVAPMMFVLGVAVALMPWLSRLVAKLSYRAALDDFALHVGGEALPWNKITRVEEQRTWRRTTMTLNRDDTVQVTLVVRDLFAGRLEPMEEIERRLPHDLRGTAT